MTVGHSSAMVKTRRYPHFNWLHGFRSSTLATLWSFWLAGSTANSKRSSTTCARRIRCSEEKPGKKRILLNDDQRRRLAVKGRVLGRKRLEEVGTLFTPDTILRWHRLLVAKKWDYSERRKSVGRPRIRRSDRGLDSTVRRGQNPSWGSDRIQERWPMSAITSPIRQSATFSKRHGIEPAPDRTRADHLDHVPESSLGCTGVDRLHDGGSLDQRRDSSRSTCCSPWNSRRDEFTSSDARFSRTRPG